MSAWNDYGQDAVVGGCRQNRIRHMFAGEVHDKVQMLPISKRVSYFVDGIKKLFVQAEEVVLVDVGADLTGKRYQ